MNDTEGGTKNDGEKTPWHLLPLRAVEGILGVIRFGAGKYGVRNWEKGLMFSRLFSATMRHMWAFWGGEDLDPESGLPHLDHAASNIAFMQEFTKAGRVELDDRPGVKKQGGYIGLQKSEVKT